MKNVKLLQPINIHSYHNKKHDRKYEHEWINIVNFSTTKPLAGLFNCKNKMHMCVCVLMWELWRLISGCVCVLHVCVQLYK